MKFVSFGEVLMRLSTPGHQKISQAQQFNITFGGTEMNVGATMAPWGNHTVHVTTFPDQAIGQKARAHMAALGVDTSAVNMAGDRIGTFFLETGAAMRASQIVYDRADSAFCNLDPAAFDWKEILKNADWFHWCGITPAVGEKPAQALLEALQVADSMGIPSSSDIYYRSNLWHYGKTPQQVLPELAALTTYILGSEENFEEILGMPKAENFEAACAAMLAKYPKMRGIVKTEREQVSASFNRFKAKAFDGQVHQSICLDIEPIIDRIGTGDAFIGGWIHGMAKFEMKAALDFGVASCALKHTIEGDQNLVSEAEVLNLMGGDTSGRLRR